MKQKIIAFIDSLILYDYILFGAVAALFILFLLLAVLIRRRAGLSVFMVLLAFIILLLGPTLGYTKLHDYLFKNEITLTDVRKLEFTDALMLQGTLLNTSKFPFTLCRVTAGTYKVSGNALMDMLLPLNPFRKVSLDIDTPLEPGQSEPFKLFIERFHYQKEYNITIGADCQ